MTTEVNCILAAPREIVFLIPDDSFEWRKLEFQTFHLGNSYRYHMTLKFVILKVPRFPKDATIS